MTALILVAGNSRRMKELTADCHKTLLDVGGKTILQRILTALIKNNVSKIVFVCGHREEDIRNYLDDNFPSLETTWIRNPDFSTTNTAYSVWLTADYFKKCDDDMILINGDVIMDSRSIKETLAVPFPTVLAVRKDKVAEEEVKVHLDENENITEIGKHISTITAAGESVGINKIGKCDIESLFTTLEKRIRAGEGKTEFYEASFDEMIKNGGKFKTANVTSLPVMEVDTPEDYKAACEQLPVLLLDE